jgi:hypothetical protein
MNTKIKPSEKLVEEAMALYENRRFRKKAIRLLLLAGYSDKLICFLLGCRQEKVNEVREGAWRTRTIDDSGGLSNSE